MMRNSRPRDTWHHPADLSIVFYTFIAFLCIGLPIAVLPSYVHDQLGFSAVVAGLTIGLQYLATLLSRPWPGGSPTPWAASGRFASGCMALPAAAC
jgi:hypothetical protein